AWRYGLAALGLALVQFVGITTADPTTLVDRGIDPNIRTIVLGGSAKHAVILRQITLRQGRHHTATARADHAEADAAPDRDCLPNPCILQEILFCAPSFHHDIRAKPSNLEATLWIETS